MNDKGGVAVIIPAAGMGERLAAGKPKALAQVLGITLLELAFQRISPVANQIIVTYPNGYESEYRKILGDSVHLVSGGVTRNDSVRAALKVLRKDIKYVLIHDAARALASTNLANAVLKELASGEVAVIPALPVVDTIKIINNKKYVKSTAQREKLAISQTPQGFLRKNLEKAHSIAESKKLMVNDDATLLEELGKKVKTIAGEINAFKITYPNDLERATQILNNGNSPLNIRVGIGSDTHAFSKDPDRKLWLGGLQWVGETGLDGHSDADVAIHAICDAIFSASNLGDLGSNFGVDRPEFAGASGESLLKESIRRSILAGYEVVNICVQIICNTPKIGPRRDEITNKLSEIIGTPAVTVTATSTDGLGMTGEGRGISAIAVATLAYQGISNF